MNCSNIYLKALFIIYQLCNNYVIMLNCLHSYKFCIGLKHFSFYTNFPMRPVNHEAYVNQFWTSRHSCYTVARLPGWARRRSYTSCVRPPGGGVHMHWSDSLQNQSISRPKPMVSGLVLANAILPRMCKQCRGSDVNSPHGTLPFQREERRDIISPRWTLFHSR